MKISQYVTILDSCVLAPMPVADTLLRLAEEQASDIGWTLQQLLAKHVPSLSKLISPR
jgi:hypothetical protein